MSILRFPKRIILKDGMVGKEMDGNVEVAKLAVGRQCGNGTSF